MMRFRKAAAFLMLSCAGTTAVAAAATPNLNGVWLIDKNVRSLRTDDGKLPPMTAWAKQQYEQHVKNRQNGKINFDTTEHLCAAPGVPRVMMLPYPFEILQNDTQVAFMFGWNFLSRFAPIDQSDKPPTELDYPTAMGNASAHWEGQSLVIRTNSRSEETLLDAAGLPNSDQLRIVERWTLADDGRQLENRIRIEDAKAYTRPWETTVTYHKLTDVELGEDVCIARILKGEPALEPERWGFK